MPNAEALAPRPLPSREHALQWLEQALGEFGLQQRGHFLLDAQDDGLYQNADMAGLLVLVGNVGSGFWPRFASSPEAGDGQDHPLDRWSQRVGQTLAAQCEGKAYYPFGGPPYHPFQRWAARAEGLGASPLGLRLHPVYGLWHAYRFALLIPTKPIPTRQDESVQLAHPSPQHMGKGSQPLSDLCSQCTSQACLKACPVNAFTLEGYDVNACANYLNASLKDSSGNACMDHTCKARLACPIGVDFRYTQTHGQFHMQQFAKAHR